MKTFLPALTVLAFLTLSACSKENILVSQKSATAVGSLDQRATAGRLFGTPGDLDSEVYDGPFELKTSLTYTPPGGSVAVLDMATSVFSGIYSNLVIPGEDFAETSSGHEQVAIQESANLLSKEGRLPLAKGQSDTIQLAVTGHRYTSYRFKFQPIQFPSGYSLQLYDTYINRLRDIPVRGITYLAFTVNGRASYSSARFRLIIQKN